MSAKDHPNNAPGVPMMFPPWFERFQVKYFNPALKPIARYLPGTATIEHRGRKSGKPYETIVTTYRKGNVLAIALGHGKTDWVKNVLAAGEADVQIAGGCDVLDGVELHRHLAGIVGLDHQLFPV